MGRQRSLKLARGTRQWQQQQCSLEAKHRQARSAQVPKALPLGRRQSTKRAPRPCRRTPQSAPAAPAQSLPRQPLQCLRAAPARGDRDRIDRATGHDDRRLRAAVLQRRSRRLADCLQPVRRSFRAELAERPHRRCAHRLPGDGRGGFHCARHVHRVRHLKCARRRVHRACCALHAGHLRHCHR